ncbi:MAG: tetratricopeptide repeat protein [Cyanobacteriota bacterium]
MEPALNCRKITNLNVEKLVREASDNFSYNRNYELALEQVDEALSIEFDNVKALILKGDILFCMDSDEEALTYFEKAIKADPTSAEAFGSKAGTLDVLGRYDEALLFCDKAFKLVNNKDKFLLPSLYDQKITLLLRMRRFEEAKRALNKALQVLPEDDATYLCSCYQGMIDISCKLRRRRLAQAEKLSLKVI